MKTLFVSMICGVFVACAPAWAKECFVDAVKGSDAGGNGTFSSPWKTIEKASDVMGAGDVCRIRAGVYREKVTPGNGETFVNYQGEYVLITGCDLVESSWTKHATNIFRTDVSNQVYDVFVDGQYMDKARWPDEDGDLMTKNEWVPTTNGGKRNTGTVTFADGLPASFVGGFYTGHNGKNAYNFNHGVITGQSGNQITCANLNFRWKQGVAGHIGKGTGNVIDHLNCLTSEKEWHWQNGTIYLYAPGGGDPGSREVEVRTRIYGFDCSGVDAVQIKGLHFKGASILMDGSNDCVVDGCTFRYVSPWGKHYYSLGPTGGQSGVNHYTVGGTIDGTAGIYLKGRNNTLKNSLVMYGWGCLVTLLGSNSTVENNHIESANWITRQHTANVTVSGSNQRVLNNTLRKSTGKMIPFILYDGVPVTGILIRGNDCRQYAYSMFDGGTACMYTNGKDDLEGAVISHNLIAENMTKNDRVSCGIYLDDGAHDAIVHHNVIHGGGHCRSGIFTHKGNREIRVYHNSCWGYTEAAWLSAVWEGSRDAASMIYRNNHSGARGYARSGVSGEITQDHNREHVPISELWNVSKYDFRIKDPDSPSVDSGVKIVGLDYSHTGLAPDLGAHEFGDPAWTVGSSVNPLSYSFDDMEAPTLEPTRH